MEWSRHPITAMVGNWALRMREGALQQSRPGRAGGQIHIAAIKVKCGFFLPWPITFHLKQNVKKNVKTVQKNQRHMRCNSLIWNIFEIINMIFLNQILERIVVQWTWLVGVPPVVFSPHAEPGEPGETRRWEELSCGIPHSLSHGSSRSFGPWSRRWPADTPRLERADLIWPWFGLILPPTT